MKTAEQYADDILSMITADSVQFPGLANVRSFSEVEQYRDANDYLERAGITFDLQDDASVAFNATVETAVSARLASRH